MPTRVNKFYGAIMTFDIVETYRNDPAFGYFIFQQMIQDGHQPNDDYTLIAYPMTTAGTVMNNGQPLALTQGNHVPVTARQQVQFGNIKIDRGMLDQLYPPGSGISELRVYPSGHYKTTGYIVYTAETDSHIVNLISLTLNPSPPA